MQYHSIIIELLLYDGFVIKIAIIIGIFAKGLGHWVQHADSIEDILLNYLSGINVLSHVAGLRLQASHICECAVANGIIDEEGDEDDDDEDTAGEVPEDIAEGVAGPSKKRKYK